MKQKQSSEEQKGFFSKLSHLNKKLQIVVATISALIFLSPLIITGVKVAIPYFKFVSKGPELVESVKKLKSGLLVTSAAVSANMPSLDSTIYTIDWNGHKYKGVLSRSNCGNIYVSVRDGEIGEQMFAVCYDHKWFEWYFIDFEGNKIILKDEKE